MEVIWRILERKTDENSWKANNIDHSVRRIKPKIKELYKQMLQDIMEVARRELRSYVARWTIFDLLNMFFFFVVLFVLFLIEKKNIFVSIEMTTLCYSTFFQRLLHRLLSVNFHYCLSSFCLISLFLNLAFLLRSSVLLHFVKMSTNPKLKNNVSLEKFLKFVSYSLIKTIE